MDGLESTRQIRAFENTLHQHSRTMIVALTGVAQTDVERDAMGSGMDLFLTKPMRFKSLSQIIQDYAAVCLPSSQGGKCLDELDENT